MKTTKKQLESIIRESVKKALEGLDFGDREWMRSRQDDAEATARPTATKPSAPTGVPAFGQLIQAAQVAFRKIQATGDQSRVNNAAQLKREIEQLSKAPQSGVTIMKARMLTSKLISLSK